MDDFFRGGGELRGDDVEHVREPRPGGDAEASEQVKLHSSTKGCRAEYGDAHGGGWGVVPQRFARFFFRRRRDVR